MEPVKVFRRYVYGKPTTYPASELAKTLADFAGVKTFSHKQLDQIKDMGFHIQVVADPALHPEREA